MSPEIDMAAFGQAVKRTREERDWTSYRLAKRADISAVYLRDIEDGRSKRLGIEIVVKLAQALDTTTDALLRKSGLDVGMTDDRDPLLLYDLTDTERRAVGQIVTVLREMRPDYQADDAPLLVHDVETERVPYDIPEEKQRQAAAFDETDEADRQRYESEGWVDETEPGA